jgi:hypothetical protein
VLAIDERRTDDEMTTRLEDSSKFSRSGLEIADMLKHLGAEHYVVGVVVDWPALARTYDRIYLGARCDVDPEVTLGARYPAFIGLVAAPYVEDIASKGAQDLACGGIEDVPCEPLEVPQPQVRLGPYKNPVQGTIR